MKKIIREILITGSKGFIGNNLIKELEFINEYNLFFFNKNDNEKRLEELIFKSNMIIHLAGSNQQKSDTPCIFKQKNEYKM